MIKPCPCGKIPIEISVYDQGQTCKWMFAVPDCCGEWHIEFRSNYQPSDSEECKQLAIEAWNAAPRKK